MPAFVLSPRARADLGEIWDYTARRWGADQAERYTRQIQSALTILSENPGLGRAIDEIRSGYRKYPSGTHVIFYRQTDTGIDVIRILHQRMDPGSHL